MSVDRIRKVTMIFLIAIIILGLFVLVDYQDLSWGKNRSSYILLISAMSAFFGLWFNRSHSESKKEM